MGSFLDSFAGGMATGLQTAQENRQRQQQLDMEKARNDEATRLYKLQADRSEQENAQRRATQDAAAEIAAGFSRWTGTDLATTLTPEQYQAKANAPKPEAAEAPTTPAQQPGLFSRLFGSTPEAPKPGAPAQPGALAQPGAPGMAPPANPAQPGAQPAAFKAGDWRLVTVDGQMRYAPATSVELPPMEKMPELLGQAGAKLVSAGLPEQGLRMIEQGNALSKANFEALAAARQDTVARVGMVFQSGNIQGGLDLVDKHLAGERLTMDETRHTYDPRTGSIMVQDMVTGKPVGKPRLAYPATVEVAPGHTIPGYQKFLLDMHQASTPGAIIENVKNDIAMKRDIAATLNSRQAADTSAAQGESIRLSTEQARAADKLRADEAARDAPNTFGVRPSELEKIQLGLVDKVAEMRSASTNPETFDPQKAYDELVRLLPEKFRQSMAPVVTGPPPSKAAAGGAR